MWVSFVFEVILQASVRVCWVPSTFDSVNTFAVFVTLKDLTFCETDLVFE